MQILQGSVLVWCVYLFLLGLLLSIYLAAEANIEGFQISSSASGSYISTARLYVLDCNEESGASGGSGGSRGSGCISVGKDTDRLLYKQRLPIGGRLVSIGGQYVLTYTQAGRLVLADFGAQTSGVGNVIRWQANAQQAGRTASYLVNLGNIQAIDIWGNAMTWNAAPNPGSGSNGSTSPSMAIPSSTFHSGCYLQVTNYGDLVVLASSGAILWTANAGTPPPVRRPCVPDPAITSYPYKQDDCYTIQSLLNTSRSLITGLVSEEFSCQPGYYCPLGSTSSMENPCPPGTFCPPGSFAPVPCTSTTTPPGTYCPATTGVSNAPCPQGTTCAGGTAPAVPCTSVSPGSYCPGGTTSSVVCNLTVAPAGKYCPGGTEPPKPCPAGSYCVGGANPPQLCGAGLMCPLGSSSATPCSSANTPPGSICPGGTSAAVACTVTNAPPGSYCPGGSAQATQCTTLAAGSYCPGGNAPPQPCTTEATSAPRGKYCPGGTLQPTECPTGTFCQGGTAQPWNCPAGFICLATSQTPCTTSSTPPGKYCPAGATQNESCTSTNTPAGYYCAGGGAQPRPCTTANAPAGNYCPGGAAQATPCPAGSICAGGSDPAVRCTAATVGINALYKYCPGGTAEPVPCTLTNNPVGNICPGNGENSRPCTVAEAPPGSYCPGAGFGPQVCTFTNSVGGINTPVGSFCAGGSAAPRACTAADAPPGTHCPGGNAQPQPCPAGFTCPGGSSPPCPTGYTCPGGLSAPYRCPLNSIDLASSGRTDCWSPPIYGHCTSLGVNFAVTAQVISAGGPVAAGPNKCVEYNFINGVMSTREVDKPIVVQGGYVSRILYY